MVIERCCEAYRSFVNEHFPNRATLSGQQLTILTDPVKCQMWHSSFDPHIQVPQVPEAELKAPAKGSKVMGVEEQLSRFDIRTQLTQTQT